MTSLARRSAQSGWRLSTQTTFRAAEGPAPADARAKASPLSADPRRGQTAPAVRGQQIHIDRPAPPAGLTRAALRSRPGAQITSRSSCPTPCSSPLQDLLVFLVLDLLRLLHARPLPPSGAYGGLPGGLGREPNSDRRARITVRDPSKVKAPAPDSYTGSGTSMHSAPSGSLPRFSPRRGAPRRNTGLL